MALVRSGTVYQLSSNPVLTEIVQLMAPRLIKHSLLSLALILPTGSALAGGNSTVEVEIFKYQFIPQEIRVTAGDTVRCTNKEKRQYHNVWLEQQGDPEPGYLFPGETYQRSFDKAGTFPYRCGPHEEMTGVVHVQ